MKKLVIAAAAIMILAGGAMLAVYLESAGPAASPQAPEPPRAPEAPPAPAPDLSHYRTAENPRPPPMQYAPAPPPPLAGSWESVKPVARLASLGAAGQAVNRGLAQLGPQLTNCFDEVTQARYGQVGYTAAKDDPSDVETGATVLMLQLETLDGQVRIVDAPVESRGGVGDGLLSCAQAVLRGQTFPAPGVRPGSRMRVVYNLVP